MCIVFYFLNFALNVSKSVKYWCKWVKFGKDQLITWWTMGKRVQEGDTQTKTKQKIWMHLSQKISFDYIWFAHGFPTYTYTKKGRRPYLF